MSEFKLSPGGIATLACLLEVSAPKPGNVHRSADFEDVTFGDFATSAVVLGQVIDAGAKKNPGQLILDAIRATSQVVGTNTNLGIGLGMVPLASMVLANPDITLDQVVVSRFLSTFDSVDGANVFEAIRVTQPAGLGQVAENDVRTSSGESVDLFAAMKSAADRDAIARLFATGFQDVFEFGLPALKQSTRKFDSLNKAIVFSHVAWMARSPDSLIQRKCGRETALQSQALAAQAMATLENASNPDAPYRADELDSFWAAVGDLDFWLRSDGHRRNPGTTADLIAISLFVAIQNRILRSPFR